jgi:hypothetical protein
VTRRLTPVALPAALLLLPGCIAVGGGEVGGLQPGDPIPTAEVDADGTRVIPLEIQTGPQGQVLAYVPVTINGEGPYSFALDTGASNSVVDADVAAELGLPVVAQGQPVAGVASTTAVDLVDVESWGLAEVDLEPRRLGAIQFPEVPGARGFDGLLGSDVLSGFGQIVIDYGRQELRLPALDER